MALFPGGLSVLLQPSINDGDEVLQHRIAPWLNIRQIVLAPVFLVGVLADSLKAVAGYAAYSRKLASSFSYRSLIYLI